MSINSKMNKYIEVYIHAKKDYIVFFLKEQLQPHATPLMNLTNAGERS